MKLAILKDGETMHGQDSFNAQREGERESTIHTLETHQHRPTCQASSHMPCPSIRHVLGQEPTANIDTFTQPPSSALLSELTSFRLFTRMSPRTSVNLVSCYSGPSKREARPATDFVTFNHFKHRRCRKRSWSPDFS